METYSISFRGETLPGHDLASVKRRFVKLFRLTRPESAEPFFTGQEVILRRSLDRDQAAQAFVTLRKIGMVTRIVKAQEDTRLRPEPPPEPVSPFMEYKPRTAEDTGDSAGRSWSAAKPLIESLATGGTQASVSAALLEAESGLAASQAKGPAVSNDSVQDLSTPRKTAKTATGARKSESNVSKSNPARTGAASAGKPSGRKSAAQSRTANKPAAKPASAQANGRAAISRAAISRAAVSGDTPVQRGTAKAPETGKTQKLPSASSGGRRPASGNSGPARASSGGQTTLPQTPASKAAGATPQSTSAARPSANMQRSAPGKPRRKRQAGAPNLFDVRLSDRALGIEAMPSQLLQVSQAPMIAAAIVMFALLLVGIRFWIDSQSEPAYGIGSVAVDPSQRPVVEVNDLLLLHDRAGIDTESIPLADLGAKPGARLDYYSNGDLLLLRAAAGDGNDSGMQLARCDLDKRDCEIVRSGLGEPAFVVERRTDTIYLVDAGSGQLQKLDAAGNELAIRNLELVAPVAMTLQEGLLYITQGGSKGIQVRRTETAEFGVELETVAVEVDGADQSGHVFPTDLAWSGNAWWVIMQSRDASTAGLYHFSPRWVYRGAVALGADAHPTELVSWAGKLLVTDNRNGVIYRVDDQGRVEKPFNEEALAGLLEERRSEISLSRSLKIIVLLILFIAAAGLLAVGTLQSLQRKLYRPASDTDEANFDISDDAIEWLDPAPDTQQRLRYLGYAIAGISAVALISAVLADFSIWSIIAISLVLAGLGGYYFALQQCSGCHLGLLDDKLILVDHNSTYRIGRGPKIQYVNNFIMIDDVIVYLGNRLIQPFAGDQLRHQFEPIVTRGIRVDGTTLQLKLIDTRHPMLFGAGGLIVACCFALLVLILS